jgi:hypothetical protein
VQIRESLVLPLWQDLSLHWMMAEKDDWIEQSAVPVAFSAIPNPENERQSSKRNPDAQPKEPVEEHDKSVQSLTSRNIGQDKPHTLENSESLSHSLGHGSTPLTQPQTQPQVPHGPSNAQMQLTAVPHSQSAPREAWGTGISQSRGSDASAEQARPEHSFSSRLLGASPHAPAPASIREENESDLAEPLLDGDDSKKEKPLGLSSESDADRVPASDRAAASRPSDTDPLQPPPESSSSETWESQNPRSNQLQVVSHQESHKADTSKEPDSGSSLRRAKIFSLGKKTLEGGKKKMGSVVEEGRRLVQEKMNREKREAGEGGPSSRHHGSGGH